MLGDFSNGTVGIQNLGGVDGLEVAYNNNYLQNLLSVKNKKSYSSGSWYQLWL